MISIKKFVLGQLQTNTYLLISEQKNCYIIDPADDFVFISDYINQQNLKPIAIILTHGHFDHCLVALPLKLIFKIPILANFKDLFLLKNIKKSSNYWTNPDDANISISHIDTDLSKLNSINFDNNILDIIATPGHTPGSTSIFLKSQNTLFSGDSLFKDGIGRTDFSYSSQKDQTNSLKTLLKLPGNTIVCPGHGQNTTIAYEKKNLSNLL